MALALGVGEPEEPIDAATRGCAHGPAVALAEDAVVALAVAEDAQAAAVGVEVADVVCVAGGPNALTRKKPTITTTGRLSRPVSQSVRRPPGPAVPWRLDLLAGIPPPHSAARVRQSVIRAPVARSTTGCGRGPPDRPAIHVSADHASYGPLSPADW